MNEICCDFCSAKTPKYWYPAKSFDAWQVGGVTGNSVGDWAACEACHVLIEANDRAGVTQRSIDTFEGGIHPDHREAIAGQLKHMHELFFANRLGPAKLIEEKDARPEDGTARIEFA